MDASFKRLARRQLSQAIAPYGEAASNPRPRDGWIAAIREGLDMTLQQFAGRLGVTTSNALRLEHRERDDTVSLGTLRRAADALDCDLVYAVVPRSAVSADRGNALDVLIEAQARKISEAELGRVAHSMALENQAVSTVDLEAQIAERAAELTESPRRLWDVEVPAVGVKAVRRRRPEA